jgi:hypothetical protein
MSELNKKQIKETILALAILIICLITNRVKNKL